MNVEEQLMQCQVDLGLALQQVARLRDEAKECEGCSPSQEATWSRLVTSIEGERDTARATLARVAARADEWQRISDALDGVRAECLGDVAGDLYRLLVSTKAVTT